MAYGGTTYIMSNKKRNVLYIGVTSELISRVIQHKKGNASLFTKKYKCQFLVYFEHYGFIEEAIAREKVLKNWKRAWKYELIRKFNPDLRDLSFDIGVHPDDLE